MTDSMTETTVSEYLHGMALSTDLEAFLNALTRLAVQQLSHPEDGPEVLCGITLLRHRKAGTVASSSERAQAMDELQYRFDNGPCLDACREEAVFYAADLSTDGRWPGYAAAVVEEGVRSVLAIPFVLPSGDRAAMNLYSEQEGDFVDDARVQAESFAAQASQGFAVALRLAGDRESVADLKAAMASRTAIDLAVGIIMGQNHCTQEEAFGILRSASNSRNIKLRDLASSIVQSTGGNAASTHFDQ
ncbi:MAG TPA: GAF and ANTAR domain-containing protein [Arthrobacter sp.]|nr:GAF and ANTAR domain-containing protein [Arthrobacter sp.]